jgi:hypothetical protein
MPSARQSLSEILSVLTESWRRQGIACPPAALADVRRAAASNGVVLPADFEHLYTAANGTPDLYPNELDERYCSFLPLEALRSEANVWTVRTAGVEMSERATVTAFVDFMHRSWEYGFLVEANGQDYRIGRLPGGQAFEVLTTSLSTFLHWYAADADELYG